MKHAFKFGDETCPVDLSRAASGYRLHRDNQVIPIDLQIAADGSRWLTVDGKRSEVIIATHGDQVFIHYEGETFELRYWHPLDRLAAAAAGNLDDQVLAPMPGSVISIAVSPGDAVEKGQKLMSIESMKMETTLSATRDGVVAEIAFEIGQTFERDAVLLELEPKADGAGA